MAKNQSGIMNPAKACYPIGKPLRLLADSPVYQQSPPPCFPLDVIHEHVILEASLWSYGLSSIVTPIVNKRMKKARTINFFISMLFIAGANASVLSGAMLNIVAHHPDWQGKIYGKIKAAAEAHSTNKDAPLVE
ncbi:MAG: hypothetical protein FRX48_06818 [Lasallia pustulata]|uniref:Uncharacterized protein n=1 Tax=Lasallia pustulata TaxID=136370 RepID=A0A5M8PK00_9LECA|nr:MAG: hypothetical protein FRX48_06818 [Lasallia pustulata]